MDIASGISAASQAIGIAKALRGIEKSYDEAAIKAQLAELLNAATDAKMALADAKEGLAERDREIERLKAAFEDNSKLVKGPGDYDYKADETGRPLGYPICPKCQPVDGRIVQLKQHGSHDAARCPVCESEFKPVTSFLYYQDDKAYTKQDEYDDKVADMRRRQAEGFQRLGNQLGGNGWMAR